MSDRHTTPRVGGIEVMLGPTRRQFDKGLAEVSSDTGYQSKLRNRFQQMSAAKVPVIFSLMHLAVLSGVRWSRLRTIVKREELATDYHVYPKPKSAGGTRWICVPAAEVRAVQGWITEHILSSEAARQKLHSASHAYAKGCAILRNAMEHAGARWIVKVDIHNFFESVSERQVYRVFRQLGYSALLAFEMTRICTRVAPPAVDRLRARDLRWRWNQFNRGLTPKAPYDAVQLGHLPQGSPSSPILSNLVMVDVDKRVNEIAERAGGVYTRYADDLVISFTHANRARCEAVLRDVRRTIGAFGFVVNKKKSHVLPPGARKVVTGLVVNDERPRLRGQTKSHIEVALHYIETRGLLEHVRFVKSKNPISYLNHLSGLIQFARHIEPDFGLKAERRFAEICLENALVLDTLGEFSGKRDYVLTHRGRSV